MSQTPPIATPSVQRRYSHRETFHWRLRGDAEKVWAVLADTERFNEAAALPRYTVEELPKADGEIEYRAAAKLGPLTLRWRETPTNWVHGRWFRHERVFENGPLRALCATLTLFDEPEGLRAEYLLEADARGPLGWAFLSSGFFASTRRKFAKLAEQADAFACGAADVEFAYPPPRLQPGARERLTSGCRALERSQHGHGLAERLGELITKGAEMDVRRIRPLALAQRWGAKARHAVELCLQGARDGLLGFRWELLCPRCQSAKASAPSLDRLPDQAHCGSCGVTYGRDYADNIELSFFPAAAIRRTDDQEFCLFGPMTTPHIKAQITVAAGDAATVPIDLRPGLYRVRTLQAGGEVELDWDGGAFPQIVAKPGPEGHCEVTLRPADNGAETLGIATLTFINDAAYERTFIVESRQWRRDALTFAQATNLQAFGDLFSAEALRPGDYVELDHVCFLFADLKGSTALYEDLGDAAAYARNREFFAMIGSAVRECSGAVVKTVGDAVHAAFADPAGALDCALRIQADFAAMRALRGDAAVEVKMGLHAGRCLSVALNGRLDYYGSAVNLAARLCDQSGGGEIVLSEAMAEDPSVARQVAALPTRRETASLKGVEGPVALRRLPAGAQDIPSAAMTGTAALICAEH